ncbi:MAG TPA: CDP-alcohol phosphatidyltransferase family protein, partial [Gemmatimonadales bacterium]|nr:CDP-alcohol phosphatidyltransferase family protein [Gemmatimonadales bacterium]
LAGLGLLLYATSVVIDHADGDLARLTFQESTLGERLDFACDTVVHAAVVLAMGATARREAALWRPATARREAGVGARLGALAAAGVVLSAVVARFLPPRRDVGLGPLLRGLGNRDLFYAMLAAFASGLGGARRSLPWAMGVLAVGSQAYWLAGVSQRLRERSEPT